MSHPMKSAQAPGKTPNQFKFEAQRLLLAHVARTGESISAIARATGLRLYALQKIQKGISKSIKQETAEKLATHFNVTVAEVLGRPAAPANPAESFPTQLARALAPERTAALTGPADGNAPDGNAAGGNAAGGNDPVERTWVPWSSLVESPFNPRQHFDPDKLRELAASIHEQGVLQELTVRPLPVEEGKPARYEIVFGARRKRAVGLNIKAKLAAPDYRMPVRIRAMTEPEARAIQLIENLQREPNTPSEEGDAFVALTGLGYDTKIIAQRIGKSLTYVQQRIALVKRAAPELRKALDKGQVTFDAARTLASAGSAKQQVEIVAAIKGGDYRYRTADMIRTELTRGLVPGRFALFNLTDYQGGTREVDGETYLEDRAQFDTLQDAALAGKQKELQAAGWSWVDQREFFHAGDYAAERSTDKKKAGCLIVLKHTGEVEIHEGLVSLKGNVAAHGSPASPGRGDTGNSGSGDFDAYQKQTRAGERFLAQLGDYIARRPALALRLFVFQEEQSRAEIPAFGETRIATWAEIAAAGEKQLGKIVLPQIGFNPNARADEAILDLAKKANLKVPAHMQPPAAKPATAKGTTKGSAKAEARA